MPIVLEKKSNHNMAYEPYCCKKCKSLIQFFRSDITDSYQGSFLYCPVCSQGVEENFLTKSKTKTEDDVKKHHGLISK